MEKQTINAIKSIYKFNQECKRPDGSCLLDQGYNDLKESAFSIEEMLEGFSLDGLEQLFDKAGPEYAKLLVTGDDNILAGPKHFSRAIIGLADAVESTSLRPLADVDRLDKHIDSIIYNFGSIFKLGLTPQQSIKALSIVADANLQKLLAGQDSEGKQKKPEGFIPPEEKLQKILEERQ